MTTYWHVLFVVLVTFVVLGFASIVCFGIYNFIRQMIEDRREDLRRKRREKEEKNEVDE